MKLRIAKNEGQQNLKGDNNLSFKFTFLGLELSKNNLDCADVNIKKTMAKKLTSQQKKFKKAQAKCHRTTTSPKDFGKCMSEKLTTSKKTKKKKPRRIQSTISRKYAKELEKKYGKKIYTKSKSGLRVVD